MLLYQPDEIGRRIFVLHGELAKLGLMPRLPDAASTLHSPLILD